MQTQILVEIENELPNTHYFKYKNKQYPINFQLFKIYSKYFYENRKIIKYNKEIRLIDESLEEIIDLPDESINDFIKFVHHEKIPLNNENVIHLNFLSKEYQVLSLIKYTNEYISIHHQEIALKVLLIYQHKSSFNTDIYEDIISKNLATYIKDDQLISLQIPILYRILSKYQKEKEQIPKKPENDEIYRFLFKCLDKYQGNASILFYEIDLSEMSLDHLNLLITKYSNTFDFNYFNSSIIKKIQQQNDLIESLKKSSSQEIDQIKGQIKTLQLENDSLKANNTQQKQKIKKLEKQIQTKQLENDSLKASHLQMEQKIKELENQISSKENKMKLYFEDSSLVEGNKLKKGDYVVLDGRLCVINEKTKISIIGKDIFTGKMIFKNNASMFEVPKVEIEDYALINIDGKNTQLLDLQGNIREDVELGNDEISQKVIDEFDNNPNGDEIIVKVVTFNKQSKIVSYTKNSQ